MIMDNKINIAELLKDCPSGMELDCTLFEGLEFDSIVDNDFLPIRCRIENSGGGYNVYNFTKYGCWVDMPFAKCVIFPKGKTTWEGFQRPFKDGDIIYNRLQKKICIYYLCRDGVHCIKGCRYNESNMQLQFEKLEYPIPIAIQDYRLATEEEKAKLLKAIKDNGYRWDNETKTLEKLIGPNFHEGDWIACEEFNTAKILSINIDRYEVEFIDGNKGFPHIDYIDRNFHLWTIQDAKDGDVLAAYECLVLFKKLDGLNIKCYCNYHFMGHQSFYVDTLQNRDAFHPATKEQRDLLFQKMKEAGYKWNSETKTLEKLIELKFKVGDKIVKKDNPTECWYVQGVDTNCNLDYFYHIVAKGKIANLHFKEQDDWELVPNKFDITNLKPYESRVLVRGDIYNFWKPAIFGFIKDKIFYLLGGAAYEQCIPYKNNEHLLGTKNDCDDFYKTWE